MIDTFVSAGSHDDPEVSRFDSADDIFSVEDTDELLAGEPLEPWDDVMGDGCLRRSAHLHDDDQ